MRVSLLAVVATAFVLALGGTAFAQDNPTTDTYGGVLGEEVGNNSTGSPPGTVAEEETVTNEVGAQASESSLPFTGLELGIVVLAGIGLVALGFAMRRGTRRRPAV